jgi:hypothetical protein
MGQIELDSIFGKHLLELGKDSRFSTYLDVGTWSGQGTTFCLYTGMKDRQGAHLFSLEINQQMYEVACKFYHPRPPNLTLIRAKLGSQIMSVYEIISHPEYDGVNPHFQMYYTQDVIDMCYCPAVANLPDMDVIVLDGGEFCGEGDMREALKLNPKVIALDDIKSMKNDKNHKWLSENPEWKMLAYGSDRSGWSIFERVKIPEKN